MTIDKEFLQTQAIAIRAELQKVREETSLSFIEESHKYFIKDDKGEITSDMLSVSSIYKKFIHPFDAETASYFMSRGDKKKQKALLEKWKTSGDESKSLGSYVHYMLEKTIISQNGNYKECRMPHFSLTEEQKVVAEKMIENGALFISNMEERGCVLLDTEMVLGSYEMGYFGQADLYFICKTKDGNGYGIICSDWKTNAQKNFETHHYTRPMLGPFSQYDGHALNGYFVQLPLYNKLLKGMLSKTRFGNVPILGSLIVHLQEVGMTEYKVPVDFARIVEGINVRKLELYV